MRQPCEGSSACAPVGRSLSRSRKAGEAQASEERPPATRNRKAARPTGLPPGSAGGDNGVRPAGWRDPEASPAASAWEVEMGPAGAARRDHEAADRKSPLAAIAGPEHEGGAAAGGKAAGDERERHVLGIRAVEDCAADRLPGRGTQRELAHG